MMHSMTVWGSFVFDPTIAVLIGGAIIGSLITYHVLALRGYRKVWPPKRVATLLPYLKEVKICS